MVYYTCLLADVAVIVKSLLYSIRILLLLLSLHMFIEICGKVDVYAF